MYRFRWFCRFSPAPIEKVSATPGGLQRYCAGALFAGHVARNFSLVFDFEKHQYIAIRGVSRRSGTEGVGSVRGQVNSTLSSTCGLVVLSLSSSSRQTLETRTELRSHVGGRRSNALAMPGSNATMPRSGPHPNGIECRNHPSRWRNAESSKCVHEGEPNLGNSGFGFSGPLPLAELKNVFRK